MQPFSAREIRREAFRLAYYYVCQFELAFPAITVLNIYEAETNYTKKEELGVGFDASLDRICNFLIEGTSLFDSPTEEALSRSTAVEDAFFDELENAGALAVGPPGPAESDATIAPTVGNPFAAKNGKRRSSLVKVGRTIEKSIRRGLSKALKSEDLELSGRNSEEARK